MSKVLCTYLGPSTGTYLHHLVPTKTKTLGWGYRSIVEHVLNVQEVLYSVPSTKTYK